MHIYIRIFILYDTLVYRVGYSSSITFLQSIWSPKTMIQMIMNSDKVCILFHTYRLKN